MVTDNPRIQEHGLLMAFVASAIGGAVAVLFLPWWHFLEHSTGWESYLSAFTSQCAQIVLNPYLTPAHSSVFQSKLGFEQSLEWGL